MSSREYKTKPLDFDAINRRARGSLPAILARVLPGGKIYGGEYCVKNPLRGDKYSGSFKINTRSGKWADFATGDAGGDVVSLIAYLEGCGQVEAARLVCQMLGIGGVQ
jgi:hypothetical protein